MRLLRMLAAMVAVTALAGCYDRFEVPPAEIRNPENANIAIADLVKMYRGKAVVISENLIISGRVTSSDRAGNFYRSLTVEQNGAAVEIRAGLTDMHNVWPVGSCVTVRLQGLAMGEDDGMKCIGLPAAEYSYLPVEYIPSREELDSIIARTSDPEPFAIPDYYAPMLDRSMCGRLVRVVLLARAEDDAAAETWEGYRIFEDSEDHTRIAVSVSSYANFAQHSVPDSESLAIAGILLYGRPDGAGKDMFIIKPRDESDIVPYY